MNKFVIITDTCSDLQKETREKYDIQYVPTHFVYEGKDYESNLDWKYMSAKEFYDLLREGKRFTTSAVNTQAFIDAFEPYLKEGYDILSISTTSALSTCANSVVAAKRELDGQYPDRKIICINSKNACGGLAILCVKAAKLRAEGKTIEETAAWVEENAKYINQEGSVEKLTWLKQAGRIKAASAFFGDLLAVKPLIISDVHGYNVSIEKVKGRKRSIARTVERVVENYVPNDMGFYIRHADCLDDVLVLKEELKSRLNLTDDDFNINYINTSVGACVGPGMFGVYFLGKEVTYDSLATKE
ncbi:MAG: DegV family protein [Clostridia bacterium]|nr:DegV family protein [Clostridia bacterium]